MNDVNTTNLRTLAGEGILQMSDEGRKIFFQCMDEIDELRNETQFLCRTLYMSTPESRWSDKPVQRVFPGQTTVQVDGQERVAYNQGMTLRQWYAGQVIAGILAADDYIPLEAYKKSSEAYAELVFKLADAMLDHEAKEEWAARHKKTPPEVR